MSLLTLERSSPSPHDSENEDLLSTSGSSYEGFVARDHYALRLSPRPYTSLGPGRCGDQLRIFSHLKKLVKILRPDDMLRMVVELESSSTRKVTKYLVIITTNGHMGTEETIFLGTEQDGSTTRVCVVIPLWRGTEIKLDGDGGFSVHTGDRQQVFKPSSVQSMWAALQMMYKAVKDAHTYNYYVAGLSHTWVSYYKRIITLDGAILNEWNLLGDVESFRPSTGAPKSKECEVLERTMTNRLREVMMLSDLEEVTCKQLRLQLEQEMKMDLSEYRGFLDQQMLRILGQMERPSQIFEYLYLGTEWNAANLVELKDNGVKNILNISREIDNFYPEEFKYLNIRLYDLPNSELIKHWDKTYIFIKEAKAKGTKALVHCKMGISRSAATVIAYTMKEYKMSLQDALTHVKSKRPIVNPNDGFMNQLLAYEGILRARHNELWGKQAPPRPLPLHRARSQSEPNLLDLVNNSGNEGEPELSFLQEHEHFEEGEVTEAPIFHASSSYLDQHSHPQPIHSTPLSFLSVDKTENIRNYLASMPNVAVEEDLGFGGENNQCMSESGSGYSSPVSTPTDDERLHSRYSKLAKDIRRDSKMKSEGEVTVSVATDDPSREDYPEGAAATIGDKEGAEIGGMVEMDGMVGQERVKPTLMICSSPVLPHVKTAPVPLMSMEQTEVLSMAQAVVKDGMSTATFAMEFEASETVRVEKQLAAVLIPVFQGIPKPLKTTTLPRDVLQHQVAEDMLDVHQLEKFEVEAACDSNSDHQGGEEVIDGSGTIEDPQIYSVPERVKEIEEMSLQKGSLSTPVPGTTPKSSPVPMETNAPSEGEKKCDVEELVDSSSDTKEDEVCEESTAAISRASSGHSIASFASGYAGEYELQSLTTGDDPATPLSIRHASLSPSPQFPKRPSYESHTRSVSSSSAPSVSLSKPVSDSAPSLSENQEKLSLGSGASLSENQEKVSLDSGASLSENQEKLSIGSGASLSENQEKLSLCSGAVKARVLDIERSNEQVSAADELASWRHSPPIIVPSLPPDESPASQHPMRRRSLNPRPSSEIIQERRSSSSASNGTGLHQRRETTPPALLSAWRKIVDEVPTVPVQDLKKKFEDCDTSMTSRAGSALAKSKAAEKKIQRSSNLRRSRSLHVVDSPDKVKKRKTKKTGLIFDGTARAESPSSQD